MTVTIEVKCDDGTHLYWRQQGSSTWDQLLADPESAPVITAPAPVTTTFSFTQYSGSTHDVVYRETPMSSPQSLPTSIELDENDQQNVSFSKDSTPYDWYGGWVKVPGDAR